MNDETEDQMVLLSQMYFEDYTQIVTQQGRGQGRPKRRRKRSKPEGEMVGLKKRKLSTEQLNLLEMHFGKEQRLESERKDRLASELGLDPRTVAVWFQNRRARWKSKKMEEEYCCLKNAHESVVAKKSELESEIMNLKKQLSEAEKEIKQLSSNNRSSSMSMDGWDEVRFLGEFGYEDVFYMEENNYIIPEMEWVNLYNEAN